MKRTDKAPSDYWQEEHRKAVKQLPAGDVVEYRKPTRNRKTKRKNEHAWINKGEYYVRYSKG